MGFPAPPRRLARPCTGRGRRWTRRCAKPRRASAGRPRARWRWVAQSRSCCPTSRRWSELAPASRCSRSRRARRQSSRSRCPRSRRLWTRRSWTCRRFETGCSRYRIRSAPRPSRRRRGSIRLSLRVPSRLARLSSSWRSRRSSLWLAWRPLLRRWTCSRRRSTLMESGRTRLPSFRTSSLRRSSRARRRCPSLLALWVELSRSRPASASSSTS